MESTYQMEEATISTTTREATTITSEKPAEVLPTLEVVDPIDKSLAEQPIDKINISAFVSDFNSDSPDSSSEVKTTFGIFLSSLS